MLHLSAHSCQHRKAFRQLHHLGFGFVVTYIKGNLLSSFTAGFGGWEGGSVRREPLPPKRQSAEQPHCAHEMSRVTEMSLTMHNEKYFHQSFSSSWMLGEGCLLLPELAAEQCKAQHKPKVQGMPLCAPQPRCRGLQGRAEDVWFFPFAPPRNTTINLRPSSFLQ